MKVPLSWLKEYVAVEATAEAIAERLTFSGVEVESIDAVGGTYDRLVAAEIIEVAAHPKADRLKLCKVHNGQGLLGVVCGAPNVVPGMKVVLAGEGAVLPNGMTITATRIRGEPSLGMLCAADEIGLSKDHTGLYELPAATLPGTPLVDILGSPDTVLDLEITWNRPDCLSLIGMAREVAALYGLPLRRPVVEYPETGPDVSTLTDVALEDALACPRYTARVVQGVRSGASPVWMQRRLERAGVRAISLVVDVTNYVMLECGHPLHAFDYHRLGGNRIVVRRARPGERIRTLDGVDRVLDPEVLVIADAERAVAVAGIMGGEGSEIGDSTGTVLLEAATFDPVRTHASVVRLGLSTESGYRYERRVDAAGVDWASRRAISLLVSEGGGTAARGVID
ncbi:MAG: phenylalanine--tRNA ligase subunit beta, partial [Lentisphaerae bacterium RIFOXYB12_FULL_60_10]